MDIHRYMAGAPAAAAARKPGRLQQVEGIDDADVWLAKGVFAGTPESEAAWESLKSHPGFEDTPQVFVWGKWHNQPRDTLGMACDGCPPYNYSGSTNTTVPMSPEVTAVRIRAQQLVEEQTNVGPVEFNYCLLNRYKNGLQKIGAHSDSEKGLVRGRPIACVSKGASRRFIFRHKATGRKVEILLEDGDLLVMGCAEGRNSQELWTHEIPQQKKVKDMRISLTFRCVRPA